MTRADEKIEGGCEHIIVPLRDAFRGESDRAKALRMEKVEKILQDDAVMVQPIFRPVYTIAAKSVHGYPGHPTQCHQFNKVWKA